MLLGEIVVYPQPQQLAKVAAERLCLDPPANKVGYGLLPGFVEFCHGRSARVVQHRTPGALDGSQGQKAPESPELRHSG